MRSHPAALSVFGIVVASGALLALGPPSDPGHLDCYNGHSETSPVPGETSGVRLECLPDPTTSTSTTSTVPSSSGFVESFTGNTGLDRFVTGVADRNIMTGFLNGHLSDEYPADHDLTCGPPDPPRLITSPALDVDGDGSIEGGVESDDDQAYGFGQPAVDEIYLCRDHLMTSVGQVDGYSIAWFAPDQTFTDATTVSWDVNVTDLGNRQWWEVMIAPPGSNYAVCGLAVCEKVGGDYPDGSIVFGSGFFGNAFKYRGDGQDADIGGGFAVRPADIDPEGAASKAIRRTFTLTDNGDGTITVDYPAGECITDGEPGPCSWIRGGSFPDEFVVVYKDHSYNPDKACDGSCAGYTWHWDNIAIS